ncbi:hypothetical protein RB601_007326 [Gaeumannomyces tritici]
MTDATSSSSKPEHLAPSKLGTKEYWDALYSTEITNHASNPADIGTVWFDDSDAEAKMVTFLGRQATSAAATVTADARLDRATTSFLDLGTGNGSLLHALRRAGWAGPCLGVDYSAAAVALAQQIAATGPEQRDDDDEDEDDEDDGAAAREKFPPSTNPVEFAQWDVLGGALDGGGAARAGSWDVVLDKGTFDAVCLSADVDAATGRRRSERYRARALRLLRPGPGGLFLVTSCNWTDAELRAWFEGGGGDGDGDGGGDDDVDGHVVDGRFEFAGRVEYPSFSFGGAKGQTISTVCFVKTAAVVS